MGAGWWAGRIKMRGVAELSSRERTRRVATSRKKSREMQMAIPQEGGTRVGTGREECRVPMRRPPRCHERSEKIFERHTTRRHLSTQPLAVGAVVQPSAFPLPKRIVERAPQNCPTGTGSHDTYARAGHPVDAAYQPRHKLPLSVDPLSSAPLGPKRGKTSRYATR